MHCQNYQNDWATEMVVIDRGDFSKIQLHIGFGYPVMQYPLMLFNIATNVNWMHHKCRFYQYSDCHKCHGHFACQRQYCIGRNDNEYEFWKLYLFGVFVQLAKFCLFPFTILHKLLIFCPSFQATSLVMQLSWVDCIKDFAALLVRVALH